MNQKIIEKAKERIEKRKISAENAALQNKIKAFEDPSFKVIYQKYVDQMIENARSGKTEGLSFLKSQIEKKLKNLGIGSIEPQYYCSKCGDNGIVDGKYCSCFTEVVNELLKDESGFGKLEDFASSRFDIFDDPETMKKIYSKMKEWCSSPFNKTLIFVSGDTGTGKTHLVKCMANELIAHHHLVNLTTAFAMNQDFMKSYSSKDLEKKQDILSKYLDSEILVIDDLGTEIRNPYVTNNFLYQVLNERKNKHLPTIITSNLDLKDLQDYYDERVSSRIIDKATSICLQIKGADLRLKKQQL